MNAGEKKFAVGMAITVMAALGAGLVAWGLPGGFHKEMIALGAGELVVAWLLYKEWAKL